ncbi:hypothetical protein BU14_2787s0001, partial [Porphyra umbilicalis]
AARAAARRTQAPPSGHGRAVQAARESARPVQPTREPPTRAAARRPPPTVPPPKVGKRPPPPRTHATPRVTADRQAAGLKSAPPPAGQSPAGGPSGWGDAPPADARPPALRSTDATPPRASSKLPALLPAAAAAAKSPHPTPEPARDATLTTSAQAPRPPPRPALLLPPRPPKPSTPDRRLPRGVVLADGGASQVADVAGAAPGMTARRAASGEPGGNAPRTASRSAAPTSGEGGGKAFTAQGAATTATTAAAVATRSSLIRRGHRMAATASNRGKTRGAVQPMVQTRRGAGDAAQKGWSRLPAAWEPTRGVGCTPPVLPVRGGSPRLAVAVAAVVNVGGVEARG